MRRTKEDTIKQLPSHRNYFLELISRRRHAEAPLLVLHEVARRLRCMQGDRPAPSDTESFLVAQCAQTCARPAFNAALLNEHAQWQRHQSNQLHLPTNEKEPILSCDTMQLHDLNLISIVRLLSRFDTGAVGTEDEAIHPQSQWLLSLRRNVVMWLRHRSSELTSRPLCSFISCLAE